MWRVTIETLRAGQPRPYADSFYTYRVRFEYQVGIGEQKGQYAPMTKYTEQDAIAALRLFSRPFKTKDENPGWSELTLTGVRKESDGVFVIDLVSAFTD